MSKTGPVTDRKISVTLETSYNLPPPHEIQSDILVMQEHVQLRRQRIRGYRKSIREKRKEQEYFRELAKNPVDSRGIEYNAEACARSADRMDGDIRVFKATIKKEEAGIKQLQHMIDVCEERRCLSERMSQ